MSGGSLGSRAARKALKRARREAHRKLIASSPDDRKLMTSSPADRKLMASSLAGRRRLPSRSPSQHRGNLSFFSLLGHNCFSCWRNLAYLILKKIQVILVINMHKFSRFNMNSESAIKIVIASKRWGVHWTVNTPPFDDMTYVKNIWIEQLSLRIQIIICTIHYGIAIWQKKNTGSFWIQ